MNTKCYPRNIRTIVFNQFNAISTQIQKCINQFDITKHSYPIPWFQGGWLIQKLMSNEN